VERRWTLVALAALPLTFGSAPQPSGTRAKAGASPTKALAQYDGAGLKMAQSVRAVASSLKGLSREQQAAVAALVVMSRVVGQHESARSLAASSFGRTFWSEVSGICPAPTQVQFSRGGCVDAEIAYATSMAKCLAEKGKTDSDCERQAAPEGAAAVTCYMRQIEDLAGIIRTIPGGGWGPGPFPWPQPGPGPDPRP